MEGVGGAQTVIGLLPRQDREAGVEEAEVQEEVVEEVGEVEGEEVLILVPGRTLVVVVERPLNGPGMMGWARPLSRSGRAMTALVSAPAGPPMTVWRTQGLGPGRTTTIPTLNLTVNQSGMTISAPGVEVEVETAGASVNNRRQPSQTGPTIAADPRSRQARHGKKSRLWSGTGQTIFKVPGSRTRILWTSR